MLRIKAPLLTPISRRDDRTSLSARVFPQQTQNTLLSRSFRTAVEAFPNRLLGVQLFINHRDEVAKHYLTKIRSVLWHKEEVGPTEVIKAAMRGDAADVRELCRDTKWMPVPRVSRGNGTPAVDADNGVGDLLSGPLHNSEGLQQQHLLFGWKSELRPAGKQM